MLIVTGRAGSGKSAFLGNLLVHSLPDLRSVLVRSGLADALPEESCEGGDSSPRASPVSRSMAMPSSMKLMSE